MMRAKLQNRAFDAVTLETFRGLYVSLCEEMGLALMKSASSPNIKERRDYSCALFDARGRAIAQGDHMPVHLGSMPASVAAVLAALRLKPGDIAIVNDPYHGGSHLPDITLVAPVAFGRAGKIPFYLACRAHHSDVGGSQPGSMPLARDIYQEGLIVPPLLLVRGGRESGELTALLRANVRTPRERMDDLAAQRAALRVGELRLRDIVADRGLPAAERAGHELRRYASRMMRATLGSLRSGTYRAEDVLEDDGFGSGAIPIRARITIGSGRALIDLRGSGDQVPGGVNAVRAITVSAVLYVFRCLIEEDVPANEGLSEPLTILTRRGSVLDAEPPASVAAGNVETSQRIVDVLFRALARALPGRIPAGSQGTMNNVTLGASWRSGGRSGGAGSYAYYETIAGGMGARPDRDGLSGVHTHMTNSLNTPIEALEQSLPLRVASYTIRRGTGGNGRFRGGDGVIRVFEPLVPTEITVLSERRATSPFGLAGGAPGKRGRNRIVRSGGGGRLELGGKAHATLQPGDRLIIETPGGGGFGRTRVKGSRRRNRTTRP